MKHRQIELKTVEETVPNIGCPYCGMANMSVPAGGETTRKLSYGWQIRALVEGERTKPDDMLVPLGVIDKINSARNNIILLDEKEYSLILRLVEKAEFPFVSRMVVDFRDHIKNAPEVDAVLSVNGHSEKKLAKVK